MILIYHFLFCRSYSWIRGWGKLGNTELTCSLREDAVGQLRAEPSVGKLDTKTATLRHIRTKTSKLTHLSLYIVNKSLKARKMTLQRSDHVSLVLLILMIILVRDLKTVKYIFTMKMYSYFSFFISIFTFLCVYTIFDPLVFNFTGIIMI